jgi:hypothetical protein
MFSDAPEPVFWFVAVVFWFVAVTLVAEYGP